MSAAPPEAGGRPEPEATPGGVEPRVAAEFPGLQLRWMTVGTRGGPSPRALRQRLHALSDRGGGARVVAMRTQPIAQAYRAFYRQTGLDPDATRIPSEAAALQRLLHGGYRSQGRIADALLIALVETGVPVWALGAHLTDAPSLTIRTARPGETVGDGGLAPGAGRLVVADAERVHGLLFGPPASGPAGGLRVGEVVLVSVGVDGVPTIFLDEALWLCAEILTDE